MAVQKQLLVASMVLTLSVDLLPASAQFSYRRTVGDETENQYQPGSFYASKYRGGVISNPSLRNTDANSGSFTRHSKQGDSTGIGGSTLQTTSVTSETRPALVRPLSVSSGTPLISRPILNLQFESASDSPALKTFSVRYPELEGSDTQRLPETFTSSPLIKSQQSFSSSLEDFQFGE